MGSLYHLNAEEEFENPDYFKDPAHDQESIRRAACIHRWANPDGTQKIESTGPLGKKRMETIDEEITKAETLDYLDGGEEGRQALLPLVERHPHARLDAPQSPRAKARPASASIPTAWSSTMAMVGEILAKLKELGLEDNTIVMYSTDNGAEKFSWPDGGSSPFRNEKASNWEGAYRVPCAIRWPGVIQPGTVINDICSRTKTCCPRLLAAAGVPDVKEQLLKGMKVGDKTFKVHLDGYNLTDLSRRQVAQNPRKEFYLLQRRWLAGGAALSTNGRWSSPNSGRIGLDVWQDPFVPLRFPKLFNLRSDPFETADHESIDWPRWRIEHAFVLVPAQQFVGGFLSTFREYPPSQKPGSFSLDAVLEALQRGIGDK